MISSIQRAFGVIIVLSVLAVISVAFTPIARAESNTAQTAQIQSLLKMVEQLKSQLEQLRSNNDSVQDITFTGQVISSADTYSKSVTTKANDLVVLRWSTNGTKDCTLAGPAHAKKSIEQSGVTEVRAPQKGKHEYVISCPKESGLSSKLVLNTPIVDKKHSIEFMVRSRTETKNKYVANDIVTEPGSKFDLKWKTKGYEACWFSSDRYALYGKQEKYKVKATGTSKGWIAPGPGEGSVFTLNCLFPTKDGIQEDLVVLQIAGAGVSEKG